MSLRNQLAGIGAVVVIGAVAAVFLLGGSQDGQEANAQPKPQPVAAPQPAPEPAPEPPGDPTSEAGDVPPPPPSTCCYGLPRIGPLLSMKP